MAVNGRSFKDLFKTGVFYKLDQFCDATIFTHDDCTFRVHKLFLSKESGYFEACFRSKIGIKKDSVTLDMDSCVFENILIFLYTGEVHLDDRNIATTLIAADYLLIDTLLTKCKQYALQEISLTCCVSLMVASLYVERLEITDYCYRFVQVHFGNLVHECQSDIAELPETVFRKLLSDDSLGVPDEDTVWKAIVLWVNKDTDDRLKLVPQFLRCLRWSAVNYLLMSCISKHSVFEGNAFCQDFSLEEMANASKYFPYDSIYKDSAYHRHPCKMYVFVRRKTFPYPTTTLEIFITYDEQLDIWRKIGETDVNFHVLISLGKFLFLFNTISNRMKTFDLIKKTWHDKECIQTSRQSYWVVKGRKRIYVIGGYVFMSNTQLHDVEYFEVEREMWVYCAPVPQMNICGASVVNEILYVVGYSENSEVLEMEAVVYDTFSDAWREINNPKKFRTQFAIIGFDGRMFILGGRTEGNEATTEVEVYDQQTGEWEAFTPLPFYYEQPHAVTLEDKLMVYDDCPAGLMVPRFSPCMWNASAGWWDMVDVFSPFNEIHRYEFCCVDDRRAVCELTKENKDPETEWVKMPFANHFR